MSLGGEVEGKRKTQRETRADMRWTHSAQPGADDQTQAQYEQSYQVVHHPAILSVKQ